MVFALHPLQTEAVTYVFARSTLLCTHFALWSLWLYAREKYGWSALLFGVSLLAKEEAIALPGFILLLELFERRRPEIRLFRSAGGIRGTGRGAVVLFDPHFPDGPAWAGCAEYPLSTIC